MVPTAALIEKLPALSVVTTAFPADDFTVTPSNGVPLLSVTFPVTFCVCANELMVNSIPKNNAAERLKIACIVVILCIEFTTFSHFFKHYI